MSDDVVAPETAVRIVGRDKKAFLILCDELGVERVNSRSAHGYRRSDLERMRVAVRERAAAWCRGERARAY